MASRVESWPLVPYFVLSVNQWVVEKDNYCDKLRLDFPEWSHSITSVLYQSKIPVKQQSFSLSWVCWHLGMWFDWSVIKCISQQKVKGRSEEVRGACSLDEKGSGDTWDMSLNIKWLQAQWCFLPGAQSDGCRSNRRWDRAVCLSAGFFMTASVALFVSQSNIPHWLNKTNILTGRCGWKLQNKRTLSWDFANHRPFVSEGEAEISDCCVNQFSLC